MIFTLGKPGLFRSTCKAKNYAFKSEFIEMKYGLVHEVFNTSSEILEVEPITPPSTTDTYLACPVLSVPSGSVWMNRNVSAFHGPITKSIYLDVANRLRPCE